jgi:IMP dehydrogenase
MKVGEVLKVSGRPAVTVEHSASVQDAVSIMSEKSASCLIVHKEGLQAGIFTEHDIIRAYGMCRDSSFLAMPLERAMTNKVITVATEADLDSSVSLMLKADIRHLPVTEGGTVVGVLHLCDLVHYKLEILSTDMERLEDYVKDLHGAMTD